MGSLRDAGPIGGSLLVALPAAGGLLVVGTWWYAGGGGQVVGFGPAALGLSLGRLAGLLAGYLLIMQLVLASRLPAVERRVGLDCLLRWHQRNGALLVTLVGLHVTLVVASTQQLARLSSPWQALRFVMETRPGVALAVAGGSIFAVIAASSLRRVRNRLPYEAWHAAHLVAYVAVALTVPHQVRAGSTLAAVPGARAVWVGAYVGAACALVGFRWVRPAIRAFRHRARVVSVDRETADVASLLLRVRRPDGLNASAGQFFIWRAVTGRQWWRPHPFSLSAAPSGDSLRITLQTVGAGTARLVHDLRPGTTVLGEGPYGGFTADRCRGEGVVLLGAGVGVTPLRALAETVDDRAGVVVLHRVSRPDQVLFDAELRDLVARRAMSVRLLVGPRRRADSWLPELDDVPPGLDDRQVLRILVPDVAARDVFVCGPPAWTDLVRRSLAEAGVPRRLVHVERFGW
ncbi:MAG: ferredoxin reductase family protein [Actinomycetes bacterium]